MNFESRLDDIVMAEITCSECGNLKDPIYSRRKLERENKILKKCVEFYANNDNWEIPDIDSRGFDGMSAKSIIELDDYDTDDFVSGKMARKTLSEINGSEYTLESINEKNTLQSIINNNSR